jgi:hypothetical protein
MEALEDSRSRPYSKLREQGTAYWQPLATIIAADPEPLDRAAVQARLGVDGQVPLHTAAVQIWWVGVSSSQITPQNVFAAVPSAGVMLR